MPQPTILQVHLAAQQKSGGSAYFQISGSRIADENWGVLELLKQIPLLDVRTAVFAAEMVSRKQFHLAHTAAQMPSLEELGLEYECFNRCLYDSSTGIQGLTSASLDDSSTWFFPQLKVLRVHELYHDGFVQISKHTFEYHLLARQLAKLQEKGGTCLSQLDMLVESPDFHAVIPQSLHGAACGTAHLPWRSETLV